ncbi:MAG TPA: GntR family transcriptional regulator [Candidatus Copromorpha excrementigallinarum]|uniref:GntR family transcriptional regulator n=1 Tax=Candidatus Allocopromorpha excrementigallinarum TaxID=2840742 RepID=A0A9D1I1V1_9FIRM|nr:GntR family transcriptional regulator [Candidatus Copromorpha excrementigallinarum]
MVIYKNSHDRKINTPISTSLLAKLQRDILTEKLKPGQKLTEQQICEKYGVSRTPVREALRQLEADGLVENILNRGAFVIGMTDRDYEDMFQLRKIYEIQAVKWAIERITEEEMDRLEETFEFMEFYTLRNDIDKMLTINTGFHRVIYEASHNRMLQKLLSSYQDYLKYKGMDSVYDDNYLAVVLEEHRAIFKAFKDKDIKGGAIAMEIHMNRAADRRCGS